MANNKVIAICQAGGEFSSNKDGSLSYSGGEAFAIDIDPNTSMSDFISELAETFGFSLETMTLKYFLPGNKKTLITISKEKDFKRMVKFSSDAANVDIFVLPEEPRAKNFSVMPASRSSRTTASEGVVPVVSAVGDVVVEEEEDEDMTNDFQMMDMPDDSPLPCNFVLVDEKHNHHPPHTAIQQWENVITGVDQRFNSFIEFRDALHKYSVAHGFAYKYKKNDSHRVSVKCKAQGCPWRITASRLSTTQLICIKKMNPRHTCERAVIKPGYRATRGWVRTILKEKLKAFPDYKPKDIAEDIKKEYGIQLNYSQAWRAKEIAREQLQGSYKEAYSQLPLICEKIKETNPGSIATFSTKEDSSFHRLFISFYASISGFKQGSRPLLFLDSAVLNSKYQGVMLVTTAPDAENGVFPVAFAVVDTETEENWRWFLEEMKSALSELSRKITFVADFQNGLKDAIPQVFGDAHHHAYCLRQLAEKLNTDLKGQFSHEARRYMLNDFYSVAYAATLDGYYAALESIKSISPDAYAWVIESEPHHWANALFQGERYNLMESTFGLDFYSWVSEAHEFPITQMIDEFRAKMMQAIYTSQVQSREWVTPLTPSNEEKLQKEIELAQALQVSSPGGSLFQVNGGESSSSVNIVDINQCDCDCKIWRLTGLPCSHAIAVIEFIGKSPYEYCSSYFTVESYRLMYAESIHPVPNMDRMMLDEQPPEGLVSVTPPPTRRTPGRPKMKRVEPLDMIKRQLQCSKCKGLGHNKKTCKAAAITT